MKVRLYCYLLIGGLLFLSTQGLTLYAERLPGDTTEQLQAPGTGLADDSNIQFIGRWDTSSSPTLLRGYWPGVYLKTNIRGTTRVQVQLGGAVTFYSQLNNGGLKLFNNVSGTVTLYTGLAASTTHLLRIAVRTESDIFRFQRLIMDSGGTTVRPSNNNGIVEFIGDSITAGRSANMAALSSYARLTANNLNMDYVNVSYTGICLVDGHRCGWFTGMSRAWLKTQTVPFSTTTDWDFSRYQAKGVVINLGTNDHAYGVTDTQFRDTYTWFLELVRSKYPNSHIFVLRTFNGLKVGPTQDAVEARRAAGDRAVHYIDTTGWLTSTDYVDTYHLNDTGHTKVAQNLANILRPIIIPPVLKVQYMTTVPGSTPTQIEPSFRIVNTGGSSAPMSELKIRYWFTRDANKSVLYRCTYAMIGCSNVTGTVVWLTSPKTNADTYLELSFRSGTVPANGNSGQIQAMLNRSDWTNFNQTNDYSFDSTKRSYADWSRVTLYRNGTLIWGTEPADVNAPASTPVPTVEVPTNTPAPTVMVPTNTPAPTVVVPTNTPVPDSTPAGSTLKVQYRTSITATNTTQLEPQFMIINTGNTGLALSDLKIRYWFTRETNQTLQTRCLWARMGCTNVTSTVVLLPGPRIGADTYIEVGFNGGSLAANGSTGEIETIIHRTDWTSLNQSDDHSFDATKSSYTDWSRVTLYQNGTLVWGTEP